MSTKYRADVIDDLMNRVRQHHEAWDSAEAQPTDSVEVDRSRRAPPLYEPLDKESFTERAYDANMRAANWAPSDGQMFGRKGTPKYKVIQSNGSQRTQARLPPKTPFGQAGLAAPQARGEGEQAPGWLRYQVTLQRALDEIERARLAHMKPLTRGAVAEMGPMPVEPGGGDQGASRAKRREDLFEKPEAPTHEPAEPTNPHFRYDTQQLYFWQLAPSDVAGGSSVWAAGDAELTRTYVAQKFGRPSRQI